MQDCQWLRPVLVAQIEFREWTPDAHLRHPSFIGLAKWQRRREKLGKNKASVLSATGSTAEFSSVLLPDGDHATLSYASSRASSSAFSTNSLLVFDFNQTRSLISFRNSLSRIFRPGHPGPWLQFAELTRPSFFRVRNCFRCRFASRPCFTRQSFGRPGMLEAKLDSISCLDQPKDDYAKKAHSP